jgi:thiol-disulfide isomerase/thioredoxin
MKQAILVFQLLAALAGIISGTFWVKAARVKITWPAMGTLGGPAPSVMRELNEQGRLNKFAALGAGWCAFCQAIALLLQVWVQNPAYFLP